MDMQLCPSALSPREVGPECGAAGGETSGLKMLAVPWTAS